MKTIANRKGANITFWDYATNAFLGAFRKANSVSIEFSADEVAATGGEDGEEQVVFEEALKGTYKMSTQIVPLELLAMVCSSEGVQTGSEMAKEEVKSLTGGKLTLSETPVAGTLYVFKGDEATGTPITPTPTVSNKEVTITGGTDGDDYTVIYIAASDTKKTITFSNNTSPSTVVIYGTTGWKDDAGNKYAEDFKCHKVKLKKALSITYQGSGDPLSIDIEGKMMADRKGDFYTASRDGEPTV